MRLSELVLNKRKQLLVILFIIWCCFIIRMTLLGRPITTRRYEFNMFWAFKELMANHPEAYEDIGLYIKNVLLFIPFGFFLKSISYWNYKKVAVAGFITSLGIEITQYCFAIGLAEIDDLTGNTLGTALGCLMFASIKTIRGRFKNGKT